MNTNWTDVEKCVFWLITIAVLIWGTFPEAIGAMVGMAIVITFYRWIAIALFAAGIWRRF